jgi:hypothetical protein
MREQFESHKEHMAQYINKTTHVIAALDSKNNDTQNQLRGTHNCFDTLCTNNLENVVHLMFRYDLNRAQGVC